MDTPPLQLLRCSNCFVVRIEQEERPCPLCKEGTLQITKTNFELHQIDRTQVQDLLKRLMTTSVTKEQLAKELKDKVRIQDLKEKVQKQLLSYMFLGNRVFQPLHISFKNKLNAAVDDYFRPLFKDIENVTATVSSQDIDSVIAFLHVKTAAHRFHQNDDRLYPFVLEKLSFAETNELLCCQTCYTLYRSYSSPSCIFCSSTSVITVETDTVQTYESRTGWFEETVVNEVLFLTLVSTWIQTGDDSSRNVLFSFIKTFFIADSIRIGGDELLRLQEGLRKIRWKESSLLQGHAALYALLAQTMKWDRDSVGTNKSQQTGRKEPLIVASVANDRRLKLELPKPATERRKELFEERSLSASAYSPLFATLQETFLIQVFIHEAGLAADANKLATAADSESSRRFETALNISAALPHQLVISLLSTDLEVDESTQHVTWQGGIASVQFLATIPEACTKTSIFCTVLLAASLVPIGQMKFKIQVVKAATEPSLPRTLNNTARFERYKRVFISYASEDRAEVLKRVQILKTLQIDFFQDILSLEPGTNWEETLYEQIRGCDAFFLFWSSAAARSDWVKKEIIYALNIKRGSEESPPQIIPVIIEGPPPPPPPPELSFLHFNDRILYFSSK